MRILRSEDEIAGFFADRAGLAHLDGVIYSGRYGKGTCKTLASLPCPVVAMESEPQELRRRKRDLVVIRNDADEIAKAAVRAFSEMGKYRTYAYVGDISGYEWSKRREVAFARAIGGKASAVRTYSHLTPDAEKDRPRLAKFLATLEQPAAVLAANDMRAVEVVSAAKMAGIPVPGRLSVLGIDNDPYVCESVAPGISSIEPDFHAEGKAAAELLDRMMRSRKPKAKRHLFFGVKRVVLRESTPHLPPSGILVARAREFIEKHATEGICPGDVARHLGISRPLLDLRFRETQETSVGRLITATKLGEVARRLRESSLSISSIQESCGFRNANALKNLFKATYGVSMRTYRTGSGNRRPQLSASAR